MTDEPAVTETETEKVTETTQTKVAENEAGFPEDTPLAEMTEDQRNAYHRHMREQNKQRTREWKAVTGERTPEQLRAELEELNRLRTERMTDAEKAVEAAKEDGRREAAAQFAPRMARLAFEGALSHVDEDRRKVLLDTIDLSKVITDAGDIDTDKVRSLAATIAPVKGDEGRRLDYGQGRRSDTNKVGVAAGREAFEARKKNPSSRL